MKQAEEQGTEPLGGRALLSVQSGDGQPREEKGARERKRGQGVDEAEGYQSDTSGQNGSGEPISRGGALRVQAAMAWDRVQKVARRRPAEPTISGVLDTLEGVSTSTFLAGIAGSMLASAWLYGTGRKDASAYAGVPVPIVLGLGLLWKTIRRAQRG